MSTKTENEFVRSVRGSVATFIHFSRLVGAIALFALISAFIIHFTDNVRAQTTSLLPCGPTSIRKLVSSATTLSLTWNKPTTAQSHCSTNTTSFRVTLIGGGASQQKTVSVLSAQPTVAATSFTGLKPDTSYTATVTSLHPNGGSGVSGNISLRTDKTQTTTTTSGTGNTTTSTESSETTSTGNTTTTETTTGTTGETTSETTTGNTTTGTTGTTNPESSETATTLPAGCLASTASWHAGSFPTQSERFTVTFKVTADQAVADIVVGVGNKTSIGQYTDLAAIVLLGEDGRFRARSGSHYVASNRVLYTPKEEYKVEMVVDPSTHTYEVFVTGRSGRREKLNDRPYNFRTENALLGEFRAWGTRAHLKTGRVCLVGVTRTGTPATTEGTNTTTSGNTTTESTTTGNTETTTTTGNTTTEGSTETTTSAGQNGQNQNTGTQTTTSGAGNTTTSTESSETTSTGNTTTTGGTNTTTSGNTTTTGNTTTGTTGQTTTTTNASILVISSNDFNGADEYKEIPHNAQLAVGDGTFHLWFRVRNTQGTQELLSKDARGFGKGDLSLGLDGAYPRVYMQGVQHSGVTDSLTLTSPHAITENSWNHVAVVYGSRGLSLYVNGELVKAQSAYKQGLVDNTEPLVIGASQRDSTQGTADRVTSFVDGVIERVIFLPRALTEAQIREIFAQGRGARNTNTPTTTLPSGPSTSAPLPTDPCHTTTKQSGVVRSGFGAPFDTRTGVQLVSGHCFKNTVDVTVGSDNRLSLVWPESFVWDGSQWTKRSLTCTGGVRDKWCVGVATARLHLKNPTHSNNWYAAFSCLYDTSASRWRCGCRDETCDKSYWQLQRFYHLDSLQTTVPNTPAP